MGNQKENNQKRKMKIPEITKQENQFPKTKEKMSGEMSKKEKNQRKKMIIGVISLQKE